MDTFLRLCIGLLLLTVNHASLASEKTSSDLTDSKVQIQQSLNTLRETGLQFSVEDQYSVLQFSRAQEQLNTALLQRTELIAALTPSQRAQLLGFGPNGVRNLQLEIDVLLARLHSAPLHLQRGVYEFVQDIRLSPMPIIAALFQWLFIVIVFSYWLRRCVPTILNWSKGKGLDASKRLSSTIQTTSWWYIRIRNPLEWWLFLSLTVGIVSELWTFLDLSPINVILNWLLLGTTLIFIVDAIGASRYRRWRRKDEQAQLRLHSVKWIGRIIIITGMLLNLTAALGAAGGTLGSWIKALFIWAVIPALIIILRWWRPVVIEQLESNEYQNKALAQWVLSRSSGLIGLLATVVGGSYLIITGIIKSILRLASEREIVRSAMAYFFRVEIARQSAIEQKRNKLEQVDTTDISAFSNDYQSEHWVDTVSETALDKVLSSCNSERPTINVIYAGRGRGKSSFLKRLSHQSGDTQWITMQCPKGGDFAQVLQELGKALDVEEPEIARNVVNAFKESEQKIVVLMDDIQRMIRPSIGGLKELDRLVRFMRRSSQNISWVMSIEASSWRFVERARGERFLFDLEQELPRWQEEQIANLIELRTKEAALEVSYEGMELPRQIDASEDSEEEQTSKGYARIIWEYAKGNPGVALYLWSQSLFKDEQGKTVVRLFEIPDTSELEKLSVTLLLVLRAIVQLELAPKDDVANATNLSSDEVVDALRLLISKGYVERCEENYYSIHWPWYRAITTVLNRQHLLIL